MTKAQFRKIDWSDETIKEFWRYWSEQPDAYFAEALGDTIVKFTQNRLADIGTSLDFGAGTGGLLAALSRNRNRSFGLDFGQVVIDKLKLRFAKDEYVGGIIGFDETANYKEFFDTIFLIETIEHMPDRHLQSSLAAIFSMLKPGGWLFISTPNDEQLKEAEVYCPISKVVFHPMQHLRSWNKDNLYKFLINKRFAEISCREIDLQALLYHSKTEAIKRMLKKILYGNYKDPHLIAFARK
jgi:2-polyprenyl-3-methyl-5-hydroxy-6-metoxy-1,4-benzoquinol methylase